MNQGVIEFGPAIEKATLVDWLKAWFPTAYLFVTRPDAINLILFHSTDAATVLAQWAEGRVFNQKRELRWRRQGDKFAVWVLAEQATTEQGLQEIPGPWSIINSGRPPLYLWGQYNTDWSQRQERPTWIEVRIAEPLHYPVTLVEEDVDNVSSKSAFARLQQIDYCAPNGAVQFTRLCGITLSALEKEEM